MIQTTQVRRPFPQVGEIFELTSSEDITGLGLVAAFGYDPFDPKIRDWGSFAEPVLAGTTSRFMLVSVGERKDHVEHIADTCRERGGRIPSGCWLKVFNDTFSNSISNKNPVGVPDASWHRKSERFLRYFPIGRGFYWAPFREYLNLVGSDRDKNWLWLVEVDK
jgi:hypothetical protein